MGTPTATDTRQRHELRASTDMSHSRVEAITVLDCLGFFSLAFCSLGIFFMYRASLIRGIYGLMISFSPLTYAALWNTAVTLRLHSIGKLQQAATNLFMEGFFFTIIASYYRRPLRRVYLQVGQDLSSKRFRVQESGFLLNDRP